MTTSIAQAILTHGAALLDYGKLLTMLADENSPNRAALLDTLPLDEKTLQHLVHVAVETEESRREDFLRGDLSREELCLVAEEATEGDGGPFTPQLVGDLWWLFSKPSMQNFLKVRRRKLTFTEDGNVSRADLKRLHGMKTLVPGAFRLYGPKTDALLKTVLDIMFVRNADE